MATRGAHKRLAREYQNISANPPPFIVAHPSETNILEWHYILTGPPGTPYTGGQYWGTLTFPPEYPFAPPAIRMHTPSGRFQPSTRLCLSISDFHPKSFNPAWEVSTILLGLQSFMTSEEMTTGSLSASEAERKLFAARTRWWNSTGGGSTTRTLQGSSTTTTDGSKTAQVGQKGNGAIKAGDGGAKFRAEWPELDAENWAWMEKEKIDPATGRSLVPQACAPEASALARRMAVAGGASGTGVGAVVQGGQAARVEAQGWFGRYKWHVVLVGLFAYVVMARILGETA